MTVKTKKRNMSSFNADTLSGSLEILCLKLFRLWRHLKAPRIYPKETKTWTVLQFLEFIIKWELFSKPIKRIISFLFIQFLLNLLV